VSAPYYVALYGGFLVIESYDSLDGPRTKTYTMTDVRLATPYDTFEKADSAAKWAVGHLYPPDLRYFAILTPSFGGQDG
jgi:hypothetical protein